MIHIALSLFLVMILFKDKFVSTKLNMNIFMLLSVAVFAFAVMKDITVALLVAVISYVVISKIEIKEKFNTKKREPAPKPPPSKENKIQKPAAPAATTKQPVEEKEVLPKHCEKIGIRDDVRNGLTDKIDDYQTNVFCKYNMDVFYHESGTNSMDIQGIFNHEVKGYEM